MSIRDPRDPEGGIDWAVWITALFVILLIGGVIWSSLRFEYQQDHSHLEYHCPEGWTYEPATITSRCVSPDGATGVHPERVRIWDEGYR